MSEQLEPEQCWIHKQMIWCPFCGEESLWEPHSKAFDSKHLPGRPMLCKQCDAKVFVYTEVPTDEMLQLLKEFIEEAKNKPIALEEHYSRFEKEFG